MLLVSINFAMTLGVVYKKDPSTYKHHSLPNGKDLHCAKLKQALSRLFVEYATDIVVKKLVPFANSQRNESFNSIVCSKNPKTHFYGGSESNDYRVACAVQRRCQDFRSEGAGKNPGGAKPPVTRDAKFAQVKILRTTQHFKSPPSPPSRRQLFR